MPDRTDERTKERERSGADLGDLQDDFGGLGDVDADAEMGGLQDLEESQRSGAGSGSGSGRLAGVRSRLASLFSPRGFLLRVGALAAGVFAAGFVPLLPGVLAAILGILVAGFAIGLAENDRSYLETGSAGLLVGGVAALLGNLTLTIVGVGAPLVVMGAVGGLVGAVIGAYLGRDLRAGLTKDL